MAITRSSTLLMPNGNRDLFSGPSCLRRKILSQSCSEYPPRRRGCSHGECPQKVTRTAPRTIPAPPADAPKLPRTLSATSVETATTSVVCAGGDKRATIRGTTAPAAKVKAETTAACFGCAVTVSEIPSSSRACVPRASRSVSYTATFSARSRSRPRST